MNVEEIISLLPDKLIQQFAFELGVNKYSKKLQGQLLLKLLVHCILSHKEIVLGRWNQPMNLLHLDC